MAAWTAQPPQNQTITTNVIGNQPAGYQPGGGAPSLGDKVLCGELYRQGRMFHYLYEADCRYAETMDREVIAGYHSWAIPLAKAMHKSYLLTSILNPFIHAWAEEMAYRVGAYKKGNKLGRLLSFIGEPICGFIGRSLKWHSTRHLQTL